MKTTLKNHSRNDSEAPKYFAINTSKKNRAFAFSHKDDLNNFITDENKFESRLGNECIIEYGEINPKKHKIETWKIQAGNRRIEK